MSRAESWTGLGVQLPMQCSGIDHLLYAGRGNPGLAARKVNLLLDTHVALWAITDTRGQQCGSFGLKHARVKYNPYPMSGLLLDIENMSYQRGLGDQAFRVELPCLRLDRGELVALTGESGSGKSTVLELLGLVAEPNRETLFQWWHCGGNVVDIAGLWRAGDQRGLARMRAASIGFVLQTGGLLPFLSVRDNININRRLVGMVVDDPVVEHLVEELEIRPLLDKRPGELSIGQQQRVSIGRALAHQPMLLLADEPTSALDPRLAGKVLALLLDLASRLDIAVVIATHEHQRVVELGLREIGAEPLDGQTRYGSRFLG